MNVLNAKGASFAYTEDRQVFHDVTFSVPESTMFTILGSNGAGKSTLLNAIVGLLKLDAGEISVCGKNVDKYEHKDLAKIVGYIP